MRKRRGGVQLLAELPAADLAGLPRNARVAGPCQGGVQLLAELPAADLAGLPRNAQVAGRSAAASWAGHCSDMAGLPRNAQVAGPCQAECGC